MKFIAKADFRFDKERPLQGFGMTHAAMRQWAREMFKSGSAPVGGKICIYEVREVLIDCVEKPAPPPPEIEEPKE
jgi:hypothetical protein